MLNTQSMNLDLIRTFVIVGQSKDLSDASSKLKIDKSNVSRHIKALEGLMGTKLIKKNSKNYIELTEDGKLLFDGFEKAYNLIFLTEKSFRQSKDLNAGKISIGISSNLESNILNSKIEAFKKLYPATSFKIINLPSKELYEKLIHYNIDFVIDESINFQRSNGIVSSKIYEENFVLGYSDRKYKLDNLNDLENAPLILPVRNKEERILFEKLLDKNNISKNLSIETSNYNSSIDFALKGLGVALVPKEMETKDNLKYLNIDLQKNINISYVSENLSPSSREFLNQFKNDIDKYK